MKMYFVPAFDIIQPDTREVLIQAGALYPMDVMREVALQTGADNSNGRLIMAFDDDAALTIYEAFEGASHVNT